MNISSADRETMKGLSRSELSRKSGINRNKVSLIAESLAQEDIAQCIQQSTSRIYTPVQQTLVQVLLDTISDPAIFLDASLKVVSVNPAYLADI